jgi:hypothetical protein
VQFSLFIYFAFLKFVLERCLNLVWIENHTIFKKRTVKKPCIPRQHYIFLTWKIIEIFDLETFLGRSACLHVPLVPST